jgi:hypothetical protein
VPAAFAFTATAFCSVLFAIGLTEFNIVGMVYNAETLCMAVSPQVRNFSETLPRL